MSQVSLTQGIPEGPKSDTRVKQIKYNMLISFGRSSF